jgi:hypothetical protein
VEVMLAAEYLGSDFESWRQHCVPKVLLLRLLPQVVRH